MRWARVNKSAHPALIRGDLQRLSITFGRVSRSMGMIGSFSLSLFRIFGRPMQKAESLSPSLSSSPLPPKPLRFSTLISLTGLFLVLAAITVTPAGGASVRSDGADGARDTQCHRFTHFHETDFDVPRGQTIETWCYRLLADTVEGESYFVYNVDLSIVKPELAFIVEPDGALVHGSLLQGRLKIYRARTLGYNPFSVPLRPPLPSDPGVEITNVPDGLDESAEAILALLREGPFEQIEMESAALLDRVSSATTVATAAVEPWRGFWWPYRGSRLAKGTRSPLAKFDRFVRARGGESRAQRWEKENHKYTGKKWQGHCNGWAASSILRAQPTAVKDTVSGVKFCVSDIKGLFAEKDGCVKYAFFGRRYHAEPDDDLRDIYPPLFHQTLLYYLGKLKKPILMDEERGMEIENRVVSGYEMKIWKLTESTVQVTAVLKVHGYDTRISNTAGRAPFKKVTYTYTLDLNRAGEIIGGSWITKNPDFLWVPLATADCPPTNPFVTDEWIRKIVNR